MSYQRRRVVAGGCFGGVLGGILGVILGVVIANALAAAAFQRELQSKNPLDGLPILLGGFFLNVIGVGLGGILGAVVGSVLVAGLESRGAEPSSRKSPVPPPVTPAVEGDVGAPTSPPPEESAEAELARVRERIAELEGKNQTGKGENTE